AIIIDGYDWSGHQEPGQSSVPGASVADLEALKSMAKRIGAELWISAQTHRAETGDHPTRLTPPCVAYEKLIDVAIFLEPHGHHIEVRLLKDHSGAPIDTPLHLHPDTLALCDEGDAAVPSPAKLPTTAYTLLSGAASGAESEFGACAEKWGLTEVNF